jgi:hypothetical protein
MKYIKLTAYLTTIAVSFTALFFGQELKAIMVLVLGIYTRLFINDEK